MHTILYPDSYKNPALFLGINPSFRIIQLSIHTTPSPFSPAPNMLMRTEAVSFVDNVKSQFEHNPQKYERFLDIMKDLKGNVIGPGDVVLQIAALFNGYPELARQFNIFLPQGYRLQPSGEGKSNTIILITPEGTTVYPRDYMRQT